jgi:hypothetical protein
VSASTTLIVLAAMTSAVQPMRATTKFGEACKGTEAVQVGTQPARLFPYKLTFYADLKKRSYCYGACGKEQTYAIRDTTTKPIKLSEFNRPGQVRLLTFDTATSSVLDLQVVDTGLPGLPKVTRRATGVCKPAIFQEPWAPPLKHAGS